MARLLCDTGRLGPRSVQISWRSIWKVNDSSRQARVIQGYYVIIDGRRKGLNTGVASISKTDGHYYEDVELILDPAYQESRDDFDPPYRMFARPVCVI